jgi:SAM-dependent methyltransferase
VSARAPTVAVAMPSRGTMHSRTMEATLVALEAAESAGAVRRVPEWWAFSHGLPIPASHERATERALETGADLVWFIEEDNVPPRDALIASVDRMQETDAGLVAVAYPVGEPAPRGNGYRWDSVYREDGKIQFTGLGITLVRREVFTKLPRPWFDISRQMGLEMVKGKRKLTVSVNRPYTAGGIDVVFGLRVRDLGFRLEQVPDMIGGHLRVTKFGVYPLNYSPHAVELWDTIDGQQHIFAGKDDSRFLPDPTWDRTFRMMGPWISGFDIGGKHFGGKYDPVNDPRVALCRGRFPNVKRVLELGSLEGGHTVAISRWAEEVVGIEGREHNLRKARWVLEVHETENAKLVQGNLETMDLREQGAFDLVFAVGVLYHMPEPLRLLDQLPDVAPKLFLWTHHSGQPGERVYQEQGLKDPLSGMSETSTWLPRKRLLAELRKRYGLVEILNEEETKAGPAITIAAERI